MILQRPWFGATAAGLAALLFSYSAIAQTPCPGPPPTRGTAKGNFFSDAQEMDLGDAVAEKVVGDLRVIQDDQLNAYLNQLVQRLLAQMPPTQMKFRVVLVDLPVANAFTFPGGRIYVTRKLVAFAQSEDELAGVLGHELGHALTHQPAAEMSRILHEVLGVNQVGDRADIFLKYNEMIDSAAKKHLHFNPEESQVEQLVADSYGMYAMARAGYSPEAMANFWDRFAQTGGNTGNWFTEIFGTSKPNQQRLKDMKKYIAELPTACIAPRSSPSAENFRDWRQKVIAFNSTETMESLPGLLWTRQLSPPLESDIGNVKFSPDGKYLLAQDDFNVYVLTRDPLKFLFRIPVEGAEPAGFTPDSRSVLIWTAGLHIERWEIASESRTEVNEVPLARPCTQSRVSPDGNVAACVRVDPNDDTAFDLDLIDTANGTSLTEKKGFYHVGVRDLFALILVIINPGRGGLNLFHMDFSPDAHYFAISRFETTLAWDLKNRSPVKLNGSVKDVMGGGFVFLGPDRIFGIDYSNPRKSGVAAFPDGPAGTRVPMNGLSLSAPAHGEDVIVRPAGEYAVGVVDLKTGKAPIASKMPALDVYDGAYARPQPDGTIGVFNLSGGKLVASAELRGHLIGWLGNAEISPDLKWFAGSGASRGAVWSLVTGARTFHVRGFRGCGFSNDDSLYADFPEYEKEKRAVGILDPLHAETRNGQQLGDDQAMVLGKYLVYFKFEKGKWQGPFDIEVHDVASNAVLWTRHFKGIRPQVTISPSGQEMAMMFDLSSDEAKEQMKSNASLAAQAKDIGSKDTAKFVEVVDPQTGTIRGEFGLDTGKNSFFVRQALPAGKWVTVTDNQNRVLVYSFDGKQVGRVFGNHPAPDGTSESVALESDNHTVEIYDIASMEKREELKFSMPLAFYQIVSGGKQLFALTEDQTAYLLNLDQPKAN